MKRAESDGIVFREHGAFVSYCAEIDVSSCGKNVEEARCNLLTAVRLFLEEGERMGTLEQILDEAGYGRRIRGLPVAIINGGKKMDRTFLLLYSIFGLFLCLAGTFILLLGGFKGIIQLQIGGIIMYIGSIPLLLQIRFYKLEKRVEKLEGKVGK